MKKTQRMSDLFTAIGAKYLKPIDADPERSNQHEIGGLSSLRKIWKNGNNKINTTYIYFSDSEQQNCEFGQITWYNARRNNLSRSAEWRLYYEENNVTKLMKPDDLLVVAQKKDESVYFIVAPKGSDGDSALKRLLAIKEIKAHGEVLIDDNLYNLELDTASRYILDMLGIEYEFYDETIIEALLARFNGDFPATDDFSQFSRENSGVKLGDCDLDDVLMKWYSHEELLFRTYEKYLFEERIRHFDNLNEFIDFALSLLNRRKSRAGKALENHVEAIFRGLGIRYARGATTENRNKPDFLFPSGAAYADSRFPNEKLAMLAVKRTCKDRWRQVLAEARRIKTKHLLTLQPSISKHQTDEMKAHGLQLVVPASLHDTYSQDQKPHLLKFADFCELIRKLQE